MNGVHMFNIMAIVFSCIRWNLHHSCPSECHSEAGGFTSQSHVGWDSHRLYAGD